MGFLLRAGAVIALIYVLSPVNDRETETVAASIREEAQALVRRQMEAAASVALERCRAQPARCVEAVSALRQPRPLAP